jgi:hypothetical protein
MVEDANTRYLRMLESTRSLRNPDLIKDFSQSNEDYVVDSANPNNLEEQFIPDNEGWGTAADPEAIKQGVNELQGGNYGIVGDTVATGYNTAKTLSDVFLQALPAAETILNPFGEYSGPYDYFKNLGTTTLESNNFKKIAKNQLNNPELQSYLEGYKKDYVLNEQVVIDHLNNKLGLNITSVNQADDPGSLYSKYKGNAEVSNAVKGELKFLEDNYLTQNDWYEDDDFYYVKNFKEIDMAPNVAWTRHGDLQLPNYGVFKLDNDGQASMMRHSATNLKESWNPITSFLGEQGFGSKPEHEYGIELYGDPGAQSLGFGLGTIASFFTPQGARTAVSSAMSAPSMWNKAKSTAKLPWQAAKTVAPKNINQAAAYSGIAGIPVAGYFDVLGE